MTIQDFFKDCDTEQETKTRYRHLSKIFHPDLGGTAALFRELNDSYHAKLKSLHGTYNSKQDQADGKRQYQYDQAIEEDLILMIRAVQGLQLPETVEISLQGTWIWVKGSLKNAHGNYPLHAAHISLLEKLGFKLHSQKGECYYRDPKNAVYKKTGRYVPYDRIARRFQGNNFSNKGSDQVN